MTHLLCPPDDHIAGYLLGTLEEEEASKVAEHLEHCPRCQSKADQYESSSSCRDPLLDSIREKVLSPYLEEPECERAVARLLEKLSAGGNGGDSHPDSRSRPVAPSLPSLGELGEYILLERLGGGGQGEVYKAFHTILKRIDVIKMLPAQLLTNPQTVRRFDREMELIGRLNHPNIVRALGARCLEDGRRFLIMEFVEGSDVAKLLARHQCFRISDACEIARQAALGLQYIYENGLVHRDIKPANLFLSRQGQVKILDLGLGRFRHHPAQSEPDMTQAGTAVGTADYIAPEQIADCREVDIRADIYSLGCTLYKLLTGQAPFELPEYRTLWDKVEAHRRRPLPGIQQLRPELPPKLAEIVHRMLAKRPEDRFATPGEVAEALKPFCQGANLPLLFEEPPVPARLPPSGHRAYDSGWGKPAEMISSGSSGWVWELLGIAAAILILCIGILWGPAAWHQIKTRFASVHPSGEVAPEARTFSQSSSTQPTPSESPQTGPTVSSAALSNRPKDASSGSGGPSGTSASQSSGAEKQASQSSASSGTTVPKPEPIVRIELDRPEAVYYGPPAGPDGRGEKIQLTITSGREGYLYVLARQPDGQIVCLFPNVFQPDNRIGKDQAVTIPDAGGSYELRASEPYGEVVVWAWVSTEKLKPTELGVASLTEHLFTYLDAEAVAHLQIQIHQQPQLWSSTERKLSTRAGAAAVAPPSREMPPAPPPPLPTGPLNQSPPKDVSPPPDRPNLEKLPVAPPAPPPRVVPPADEHRATEKTLRTYTQKTSGGQCSFAGADGVATATPPLSLERYFLLPGSSPVG